MRIVGDLLFAGLGQLKNARIENLAADPSSPAVGQMWYNTTDGVYRGYDGTDVITFASGGNTVVLQQEIDQIEASAGLNTDGTYTAPSGTNYLGSATTLKGADVLLDTQIKANADAITTLQGDATNLQAEIDAIEAGAGLNTDGTYTAPGSTNYLGGATSLKGADVLLDTQIKTNADAIAANATAVSNRVLRAGDTMTGNLAFGGLHHVTGLAAPSDPTDAVTKAYVDTALAGLDFQADVLGIQVDATLDPVTTTGARYIVTDVTELHANFGTITGVANGDIVQYDGSEFFIAYDVSEAGEGAIAWNRGNSTFALYDGSTWGEFAGLAGLTAGVGLRKEGNVLHVNLGAGISQLPTDEVGIDLLTNGGLFLTLNGTDPSTHSDAQVGIRLDGSTLTVGASGIKVSAAGVTETELNASVAGNGLTGGGGSALAVGAGTGIVVNANDIELDLTYADGRYLNTDGDTMTGLLTLSADPTNALHAATKQYVDAVKTALEGSTFVFDSGVTSATSHVVTHNIGTKYCNVTVVDSNDKVIIPDSITFDTANQLTVTFSSAITCKVVVSSKFVA